MHKNKEVLNNQKRVRQLREQWRRERAKVQNAIIYSKKEEAKATRQQAKK